MLTIHSLITQIIDKLHITIITMDINQNTQHINTFSGGMNSDTTDAMLSNNQYRFAFDLRYISSSTNKNGSL
nr:MAG TPA: hypothetical protein [Caudoviricetes sp.]